MTKQEIEDELLRLETLEQIHTLTIEKLTAQLAVLRELTAGMTQLRQSTTQQVMEIN